MWLLHKKCQGKRSLGLFRNVFDSNAYFQASKVQFYKVWFFRIKKKRFLSKWIAFFSANLKKKNSKNK